MTKLFNVLMASTVFSLSMLVVIGPEAGYAWIPLILFSLVLLVVVWKLGEDLLHQGKVLKKQVGIPIGEDAEENIQKLKLRVAERKRELAASNIMPTEEESKDSKMEEEIDKAYDDLHSSFDKDFSFPPSSPYYTSSGGDDITKGFKSEL